MEGDLRALADGPAEQEERDERQELRREGVRVQARHLALDLPEREGAEDIPDHEDPDEEQDVAHASHEERLLRGRGGLGLRVPEAEEQVRAEAHDLPEDQELKEVVRTDGAEHAGREKADYRVVAGLAVLLVHVAERVEENQEA